MPRPRLCLAPLLDVPLEPVLVTFLPFLLPADRDEEEEEEEEEETLVALPTPPPTTPPVRFEARGCEFAYTLTVCCERAGVPGRLEPRVERTRRAVRFSRTILIIFFKNSRKPKKKPTCRFN
jgi:hypothetical protein